MKESNEIRLDDILGRVLLGGNNQPIGRIEEVRAQENGGVTEVVIGTAGMLERLNVGARLVLGVASGGRVARWDQIDFQNPLKPRLIVPVEKLRSA